MGILLKEVKENYGLSKNLSVDLSTTLATRNYLIHKYFKNEIQKFYSDKGKLEMINYFCEFVEQSKKIDDVLKSHYSKYTLKLGFTDKRIEEMVNELKLQEQKRDKL
jgi:hypothetical protein